MGTIGGRGLLETQVLPPRPLLDCNQDRSAEELYHAALLHTPDARAAFLVDACGGDEALLREVDSLLKYASTGSAFLERWLLDPSLRPAVGETLGHYEIVATLGAGAMGEVFRAHDMILGREVAIKFALTRDKDRLNRFTQEARAVAALTHPSIVTIHSVEAIGDLHFLTMELVEGVPLGERIPEGGLPLDRLLEIAIPLADAVGAAHARGIVHRDLKPANIMLTADGRLKVLDFGVAKLRNPADPAAANATSLVRTTEGCLIGTVAYMSPEQAEGRHVDHRSDIFSLGVVLHELATGRRPFSGDTSLSLLASILKDTPHPIADREPTTARGLARIVRRCLSKDPGRRYQSAIDLRNDLEELAAARPASRFGLARPSRAALRRWAAQAAAVLGALVAGALMGRVW